MLLSVDVDKIFTSWVLAMRKLASVTWLFVKEIVTLRKAMLKKIPSSSFCHFCFFLLQCIIGWFYSYFNMKILKMIKI